MYVNGVAALFIITKSGNTPNVHQHWMYKLIVVHSYREMSLVNKKDEISIHSRTLVNLKSHYVKWRKSDTKVCIQYDSIYSSGKGKIIKTKSDQIRSVTRHGRLGKAWLQRNTGNFLGDGKILYLDYGDGYILYTFVKMYSTV